MSINIAIDGPAGAGKSTVARAAAAELGFIYVDTGALYRAVAFQCTEQGADPKDASQIIPLLDGITPELRFIDGVQHVFVNGNDVSDKIRTPEISMAASAVSAIPEVRAFLFGLQKKIAEENNVIMDGRDIGTVVLPDAQLKIYLTATPEERANRRYKELIEKGQQVKYEDILDDVNKRDYADMHRETAPLKQAEDAVLLDSTGLTGEQCIEKIVSMAKELL